MCCLQMSSSSKEKFQGGGYIIFYKVEESSGWAELCCSDKQIQILPDLTQKRLVSFSCVIQITGWTEIIKVSQDETYGKLHLNTNDH